MFRIKICGLTSVDDARIAVEAGADAIGLNFYGQSSRYVKPEVARTITDEISTNALPVGLFVNHHADSIRSICDEANLNAIQLHGDEPPKFFGELRYSSRIIWARRVSDEGIGLEEISLDLDYLAKNLPSRWPKAILLDASSPGFYGGMGKTISLAGLPDYQKYFHGIPLILAGGLTPENVAEAIRVVRPHGVDVASGVESSPGVKDKEKMQAFVAAAKAAFDDIAS